MNYKDKQIEHRNLKDLFRANYPQGCVKFSKGKAESKEHKRVKAEVCSWLAESGFDFWTECSLNDGSRADIVAIKGHIGYILEILCTESEKRFLDKLEKSYGLFTVIPILTKEFKYEDFKI